MLMKLKLLCNSSSSLANLLGASMEALFLKSKVKIRIFQLFGTEIEIILTCFFDVYESSPV